MTVHPPKPQNMPPSYFLRFHFKFIDFLQDECKFGYGGRLGYIDAISDLMDFRNINGASVAVLRNLIIFHHWVVPGLKRAQKTVAKMTRLQWSQDLDIDTLEARVLWATFRKAQKAQKFYCSYSKKKPCSFVRCT